MCDYSITAAFTRDAKAGDELVTKQFGQSTGFADIGRPSAQRIAKRLAALEAFAARICTRLNRVQPSRWVGHRPMTPDNLPFLGATRHTNLWLNCGHGAIPRAANGGPSRLAFEMRHHFVYKKINRSRQLVVGKITKGELADEVVGGAVLQLLRQKLRHSLGRAGNAAALVDYEIVRAGALAEARGATVQAEQLMK